MDHADHIQLLRDGITGLGGTWADIGAGAGAFTLALADLIGPSGEVHAVDRDARALERNAQATTACFPDVRASHYRADFCQPLELPALDGIVMANALHFEADQEAALSHLRSYLKPGGRFLIVEYNISRGNFAVPHPVPFERWQGLAQAAGFEHTALLFRRPSRTLREIYSAASW
jgi:ubiquinone/menaquinone biosynthesis C-methylase UbiE